MPPRKVSTAGLALALAAIGAVARGEAQPTVRVSGVVIDSTRQRPLANARVYAIPVSTGGRLQALTDSAGRFTFDALPFGSYLVDVRHERRDSLAVDLPLMALELRDAGSVTLNLGLPSTGTVVRAHCGADVAGEGGGLVLGRVHSAILQAPVGQATVMARWQTWQVDNGGISRFSDSLGVSSAHDGRYSFCGIPAGAGISVEATQAADSSGVIDIVMPDERIVTRDLYVAPRSYRDVPVRDAAGDVALLPSLGGSAQLTGAIVAEGGQPVPGATIRIAAANRSVTAASNGTFGVDSLPAGSHMLDVRAIGFLPLRAAIDMPVEGTVRRTLQLTRLTALDTVRIRAERVYTGGQLAGFERRRKSGAGSFLTVDDIESQFAIFATDYLLRVPGVYMRGAGPNEVPAMRGWDGGLCKPAVYVDGVLLNGDAWDLTAMAPVDRLVGIEVYRAAHVPAEFAQAINGCGTILFWTGNRRQSRSTR